MNTPKLVAAAARTYRTWSSDSAQWQCYQPRSGDIMVATYPKSGTTWTQQIVSLLLHQTTEPQPIGEMSVWLDFRLGPPLDARLATLEAQTGRRFLKSHAPLDGMPVYDTVKYIHVARDGRDTCLSYHNHNAGFREETLRALDAIGLADERLRAPYPRPAAEGREFFAYWLHNGVDGATDGAPFFSWFDFERTYWEARHRPNFLLVHYADMKADLDGEMRRIAEFLGIEVDEALWPALVKAATFDEMQKVGSRLHPLVETVFEGGAKRFFAKGENERWRGVLNDEDLAAFDDMLSARVPAECAAWLRHGSRATRRPQDVS